jgi:hypothetical protein
VGKIMGSPKGEKTLEIARRTRKNLEFIYNAKNQGKDVEEFTQLLNSMLGMVISLREDYFRGDHITWQDVKEKELKHWNSKIEISGKKASRMSPNLQQSNSFSQLITKLRHAFAHNCFELIIDRDSDLIIGLKVWNIQTGRANIVGNRIWEAKISEEELKDIAYLFVEYLENELEP